MSKHFYRKKLFIIAANLTTGMDKACGRILPRTLACWNLYQYHLLYWMTAQSEELAYLLHFYSLQFLLAHVAALDLTVCRKGFMNTSEHSAQSADRDTISPATEVRIAFVDDNKCAHLAMAQVLKSRTCGWTLDSYLDGNQAVRDIPQKLPHAVLMDISMPEITGIECTKKIKALLPGLPVIVFSARLDIESFVSAMIAGASGYLVKPSCSTEIVSAIKRVLDGKPALCPEIDPVVVEWMNNLGKNVSSYGLTDKEQKAMVHICSNKSDKEIANLLGIATGTVHAHLTSIFKKLGVHSRGEAKRKFLGMN